MHHGSIHKTIKQKKKLKRINACRLFLYITQLSEIVTADGKKLKLNVLRGKRKSIDSTKIWPRQNSPDAVTWKMWSSLLKRAFCSDDNRLRRNYKLGLWIYSASQLTRQHKCLYLPALVERYQVKGKKVINWSTKNRSTKNTSQYILTIHNTLSSSRCTSNQTPFR